MAKRKSKVVFYGTWAPPGAAEAWFERASAAVDALGELRIQYPAQVFERLNRHYPQLRLEATVVLYHGQASTMTLRVRPFEGGEALCTDVPDHDVSTDELRGFIRAADNSWGCG